MFLNNTRSFFRDHLSTISNWAIRIVGVLASITVVLAYLQSLKVNTGGLLSNYINTVDKYLQLQKIPTALWIAIIIIVIYLTQERRRLSLVAGSFKDTFDKGLINWEYGGEGWVIQRGEKGYELSVSNSADGGVTNFGFGWDSYQFSFECKLINNCVGWIVRALDRENYIMVQLSKANGKLNLNPHYRVKSGWWVQEQELMASEKVKNKVRASEWLSVRIVVYGNSIDVFIDNERVLNHHIPDPIRLIVDRQFRWSGKDKADESLGTQELISQSFPNGRVGFRCFGSEHGHIRNVKVKPLFWSSKTF